MNSRQGSRYIKRRMGDELKEQILKRNGIIQQIDIKEKLSILNCPRCELVNAIENKYCSKCSYPLKPEAYDEIKGMEEKRIEILEQKYENDTQLSKMMLMIQQNPKLSYVKSESLLEKISNI
jgi:integrase/recombinase XerD